MEKMKTCPLCGKEMNENTIMQLYGGVPTLLHTCVSEVGIRIQADTKYDVIRKWNTFVTVVSK